MLDGLSEILEKYGFSLSFDNLESNIDGAIEVVCFLLGISLGINYYNWSLGRYGMKKISEKNADLLMKIIETCVNQTIDLDDDYEFSILETIILYCIPSFLPRLVSMGLESKNKYVIEIVMEYIDNSYEKEIEGFYSSPLYEALKKEYSYWEKEIGRNREDNPEKHRGTVRLC